MANYLEPQSVSADAVESCSAMAARFDVRAKAEEIAMWRAGAKRDGCRSVSGWARKLLNQRASELATSSGQQSNNIEPFANQSEESF